MRKRGPSGGGTLRRKSPQQGKWPSLGVGAVMSARIHWPRASQSGLMHCTVKPGKYCIDSPSEAASSGRFTHGWIAVAQRNRSSPSWPNPAACSAATPDRADSDARSKGRQGRAGTKQLMGRILARESCGVKRKGYKILWYGCEGAVTGES